MLLSNILLVGSDDVHQDLYDRIDGQIDGSWDFSFWFFLVDGFFVELHGFEDEVVEAEALDVFENAGNCLFDVDGHVFAHLEDFREAA